MLAIITPFIHIDIMLEGGEWMVVDTEEVVVQSEEKQTPAVLSEQRPLHFDGRLI